MKILYVCKSLPHSYKGGIQTHVWKLSEWMMKLGHEVSILTAGSWKRGVLNYRLENRNIIELPYFPGRHLALIPNFAEEMSFNKAALKWLVKHQSGFDVIHLQGRSGNLFLKDKSPVNTPVVTTLHGLIEIEQKRAIGLDKSNIDHRLHLKAATTMENYALENSDALIAVSREMLDELKHRNPLFASKTQIIYNGIDVPAELPLIPHEDGLLLFIGRLTAIKGVFPLVEAMKFVHPRVRLVMVGEGDARPALEQAISQAGLQDRIHLTGALNSQGVQHWIDRCYALILPSYHETQGIVLMEANASGKPVIAAAIGGVTEVVIDEKNGLLLPSHQPQDIAGTIDYLFTHPGKAKKMGLVGRSMMQWKFAWENIAKETEKLYFQLKKEKGEYRKVAPTEGLPLEAFAPEHGRHIAPVTNQWQNRERSSRFNFKHLYTLAKRPLSSPSLHSIGSNLALQGFALLSFMLLARLLTLEEMGIWALWITLATLVDMTRQGFIQNGLVRFAALEPEATPCWLTAAFVLNKIILMGMLFALALLILPLSMWFDMPELVMLACWVMPVWLLQATLRFSEAVQVTRQDFRGIFIANVLNGGVQFGFAGWFFLHQQAPTLLQLLSLQGVGAFTALVFTGLFFNKYFTFGRFEKARLVQLYDYGKHVGGTNFFSLLFQRLDTLLVGAFLTPAAVGIYNVATRLNGLLDLPLNGLSLADYPKVAGAFAKAEPPGEIFNRAVRRLVTVQAPLCLLLILGAGWAVDMLAGEKYHAAVPLLQVLAVAGLVKPWGRTFGMMLDAAGLPHLNFRMLILSFGINLALNLALIPGFGVTGAACGTALGLVLTIAIGQKFLGKIFNIKPWSGASIFQATAS
jgi:O-antigen/teichoic acid export membrane protein/glycosyltransferase involved in cell wall biosynthesis